MQVKKRVLVCPLNWGLGHATRCIPVINELICQGAEVIISASGRPLSLLQQEFPDLSIIEFPDYNIDYKGKLGLKLQMLLKIPSILKGIRKENAVLKNIISQYNIDIVISDNRYGLNNKNVKTVFLTHQLRIKSPFGENLLHKISKRFIKKFDEIWIPDFANIDESLSGMLSHLKESHGNSFFIGPLSRLNSMVSPLIKYDLLILLSGPEPQRTILEKLILTAIKNVSLKIAFVRGLPDAVHTFSNKSDCEFFNHLNTQELEKLIASSKYILCRSGYSTIMDLSQFGKKIIFVPTPGQTEQEYLAEYLTSKNYGVKCKQNNLNLSNALSKIEGTQTLFFRKNEKELKNRIKVLLQ